MRCGLPGIVLVSVFSSGSGGMKPEEFILFTTDFAPRVAAMKGEGAKRLLEGFRAAPKGLRSRPEAKVAVLNLEICLSPPRTGKGWVEWMGENEHLRSMRTPPDYYMNYLHPMLVDEVRERHPNRYTVAYTCAYASGGDAGEMQGFTIERLERAADFPFWRLLSAGLRERPGDLRRSAVSKVAWALNELEPVPTRVRQKGFTRRWLASRDYRFMASEWARWKR